MAVVCFLRLLAGVAEGSRFSWSLSPGVGVMESYWREGAFDGLVLRRAISHGAQRFKRAKEVRVNAMSNATRVMMVWMMVHSVTSKHVTAAETRDEGELA